MGSKISFNYKLMADLRQKKELSRSDLATLVGVSYDQIRKIEEGRRKPSVELLFSISRHCGVPMDTFYADDWESAISGGTALVFGRNEGMMDVLDDLKRERQTTKLMAERNADLERQRDHLLALVALQEKFVIIQKQDISDIERGKRLAGLSRAVIRAGEITFEEVQAALHLKRGQLRRWLESEKGEYRCKLRDGKTVMAATPSEAGIALGCFDCQIREDEDCRGFSEKCYPENLFALITLLEADGMDSREQQAGVLRDSFGIDVTAHYLSEIVSRQKRGKPAPENIVNLKPNRGR